MALLTALARFCIFINLVSLSHQFLFADTSNMLIRVRNNFGTFKVFLEDGKEAMLSDVLNDDIFEPWKLVQELSTDPSGKDKVSKDLTLSQQGLEHGSLIFCRVEERSLLESDSDNDVSSVIVDDSKPKPKVSGEKSAAAVAACQPKGLSSQQDVIELLDSSDDEENGTSEMSAKRRPPPSNTSNQTFKNKKARPTATSTVATSSSNPSINDFRAASYNVWFGPPDPDANQVYPRQRMTAIAQALKEFNSKPVSSPLLFIGFQELTESLKQYLTPHLKEMGYNFATQPLQGFYGVGLAVSTQLKVLECQFVPFPTNRQGRGILYARTEKFLFVTTHLESFEVTSQYTGVEEREAQIKEASRFCQEQLNRYPEIDMAVIAGDFNWDDERKQKSKSPNQNLLTLLKDGWNDAGKSNDHTYDGKENQMLTNRLRRRLDRCIYMTNKNVHLKQVSLEKLGKDPIPNLIWSKKNPYNGTTKQVPVLPSDHFGIGVQFQTKRG